MLRVAVIGAGHWGPNLIRNFDSGIHSKVSWVVDRDPARIEQVKKRFPHAQLAAEADAVFADPAVDAVVIATPTVTHVPLVRAALEAGKHVLVEKPIATRGEEGAALCDLAEKAGKVLMVGHVFLYNGAVREVKKRLDEGSLGRIYYLSMVRTNLGPIRMDVNAAWDLAAHDVSIASYWLGADPLAASAYGGTWINPGLEDAVFATLRYPNDVLVNLHASWLAPRKARDITVVGDRRMLTFDDANLTEPIRIYDKQVTDAKTRPGYADSFASFRASVRDGDITIPKVALGEPLKAECDEFVDCVLHGKKPVADGRVGTSVVRALEAIEKSLRARGAEVEVET